uniref:Uncharacterized protein n=1 Tax=Parascaris univalens TaxID=6257 RepID=A0A915B5S4_PARUN
RYLNSCFEDLREWIIAYMRSNQIDGKFHQIHRTGSIQATDLQTTSVTLRLASLEHHRGEHYVQMKGFNIKLKGNWYYKLLYIITDSGTFSLSVSDMNITIGNIEPEVFSGLPFINTDLNCKVTYAGFAFSLDHPKILSNILSGFMYRLMRNKFENTICGEVTRAFDAFLRHGVEQLSFRHALPSGAILNNSLVSRPLLSAEGDLTTYHYGIIKESTLPVSELSSLERRPHDVTYLLKPQLLEEILSTIHQKSLFDGSYKDDHEYSLTVKCIKRPEVRLGGEDIIAILDKRFVVTSNNIVVLNDTFSVELLLKALYSRRLQLRFQVLQFSSMDFLFDDLHGKFASKLQRQWSTIIGTYLRVPLPSAFGIVAKNASLTV